MFVNDDGDRLWESRAYRWSLFNDKLQCWVNEGVRRFSAGFYHPFMCVQAALALAMRNAELNFIATKWKRKERETKCAPYKSSSWIAEIVLGWTFMQISLLHTLWSSPGRSLCVKLFCCCSVDEFGRCAYFPSSLRFCTFLLLGEKLRKSKFIGAVRRRRHQTWQVFAKLSALLRARTRKTTDTLDSLFDWLSWNWKKNQQAAEPAKRVEDVVEKQTFVFCD